MTCCCMLPPLRWPPPLLLLAWLLHLLRLRLSCGDAVVPLL